MKTTCLINNFNYGRYIVEAVHSVLNQSVSFDEIIVVDDCSTDNSADILLDHFSNHPDVKLILKEKNGGQLSCFDAGFQAATGDLIFFLDSDDVYKPDYLKDALKFYAEHPSCDFLFCAYENFGSDMEDEIVQISDKEHIFGCSALRTLYSKNWIGSITSVLSVKRHILSKVLPIPYADDWRTRADDCLVWGTSLAGAMKVYTPIPYVRRRLHSSNDSRKYPTLQANNVYLYQRYLKIDRLFGALCERMSYTPKFIELANLEFRTIPSPSFKELKLYVKMVSEARLPISRQIQIVGSIVKHFFFQTFFADKLT
ncbi:MAG: glycosyltransferase family 2 protein [Oscillatoriophycideae cyanobacterium NC_groundwater_1537_Pr4_S-0.65um_50_18]|nr:glycosyltransferase family 2 protein [Oscillatoriophycideae cyanobacterium NC_groundwater_1537_Pr4_S-0.65um_50_18]